MLLAPPHAVPLAEGGFTREGFQRFLQQHMRERVDRIVEPQRKLYADGKAKEEYKWLFELSSEEAKQMTLPCISDWRGIHVIVAGSVRAKDLTHRASGPVLERITATPGGSSA